MVECHTCGRSLANEATVCPDCGTSIAPDVAETGQGEDRRHSATDASDRERQDTGAGSADSADLGSTPAVRTAASPQSGSSTESGSLAGRFWLNSVLGGALGFLLAMVIAAEFPPAYFLGLMGGAFIGGLVHEGGAGSGGLVGGMAGFLATIPFVGLLIAVVVFGAGMATITTAPEVAPLFQDDVLAIAGIVGLLVVGFIVVANIVAGALGGLLGGAVASE